jgi:hypothetical protein
MLSQDGTGCKFKNPITSFLIIAEICFLRWYHSGTGGYAVFEKIAGDESRTRDLQLGKLSLLQYSMFSESI